MKRETRIDGIRRLLRLPSSNRAITREIDDEIGFHLESRVRELTARGLAPDAARAEAEREFGDLTAARRELSRVDHRRLARDRRALFRDSLWQDLRYALRGLRRQPSFTAVVVATLTLGIGANAVVFGLVDRLLLSPPPHVDEPDDVVRIAFRELIPAFAGGGGYTTNTVTAYPMVTALREVPGFEHVAAYFRSARSMGRGADAREVDVSLASGNFFELLGAQPALGRFFAADEDRPPVGADVAVLGHGFWQSHFGGTADVLGSSLDIDGRTFTVVGVAPRGFSGVDLGNVDVWIPVSALAAVNFGESWHDRPYAQWARIIARIAPGVSQEQAAAQATVVYRREIDAWDESWRDSLGTVEMGSIIAGRNQSGPAEEARVSLWLMGVSLIVLLIACANIANLLLARAVERRREIAVRLAIGVGRARLVRQLVTEALLLAGIAAAAALVVAHWGGQIVRAALLPSIEWYASPVSMRVLAFTAVAMIVTGVLAGVAPAIQGTRTDLSAALRTGGREGGGQRSRARTALLIAQAALSVVLLVGAGLFVRSLRSIQQLDVGVDLDRVVLVQLDALYNLDTPNERIAELFRLAHERVRVLPGVESASLAAASAPMRMINALTIGVPGRDSLPSLPGGGPYYSAVGAGFFGTIGARVVNGRDFDEADVRTGAQVMLINEVIAEHYWPGENPVGQCVTLNQFSCSEIIGVVQNVLTFRMLDDERAMAYVPITHPVASSRAPNALLVRTTEQAPIPVSVLRRAMQALASDLPYVGIEPYASLVAPQLQPWRLGATMFGVFGGVALLIAAVGLYSVIAYLVTQRRHEIGVRMALGATRRNVVGLVLGEGMRVALIGLVLGILTALAAGRFVADLLHGTSPRDPGVIGGVAVILALVAAAAALVPSWRASRVDPATALRAE